MEAVARAALQLRDRCVSMSVLDQDAALYLASGLLALGTVALAVSADYRQWAELSVGPYLLAAVICFAVARRRARRGAHEHRADRDTLRRGIVIGLLVTTVVVPLSMELVLRAHGRTGAEAQVEVSVLERCGDRVANGHNCYLRHPTAVGVSPHSDAPWIDRSTYFPYLPAMIPFGLYNAIPGPPAVRDSRVALSGFTLLVVTCLLYTSDAADE